MAGILNSLDMGTKKFILDPVNSTRYNTNTKCKTNGEKSLKTYSVHFLHCIKVFKLHFSIK